jgi:hypothetical protein
MKSNGQNGVDVGVGERLVSAKGGVSERGVFACRAFEKACDQRVLY